ncbi:helix-turn-helix transcriptional regulator [Nocardia sp. NRRL S-836]|uniref:helix-turn-helix domain-containing protein n=1 Tax=Nocardia sp. NRRL S-836 TaxID=1519492 RepID=UPI0012FC65CB|nr:helix-turn-helix transcriptional regulator [Nocardia sp. NRRL S-836]
MPKDFRATTLERAVGRLLAGWRNERGLSLTEGGQRVGFSSAKLSMMENAAQPSAPVDIMASGYVYKVPTPEWQVVMVRAQHAASRRTGMWPEPITLDPAEDLPLLAAEASRLRTFTTDTVPSVFQLAEYTAATAQQDDPTKAAPLSCLREVWTTRLDNDPLIVEAVFPEAVLRRAVGGRRVMRAQLLHLMEVSERPDVSVRVLSDLAGAYPAMGCPFTWLSFPRRQHDDVVYIETFLRSEYVEDQPLVARVAERFCALSTLAL